MKKTISDVNLNQLFMKREMEYVPTHFVRTNAPLSYHGKNWVLETLTGRFAIVYKTDNLLNTATHIAFEDPEEAIFYELKWS